MVSFGTQTDVKLLEYVTELEIALNTTENKISELLEARFKYWNLWMTEHQYSKLLEEAGAEGGSLVLPPLS